MNKKLNLNIPMDKQVLTQVDALLHAADIRGNRLGYVAASRKLLDSILTRYPSGDMAEPARELLRAWFTWQQV